MTSTYKLPRYVYLLLSGQAINLSTAILTATVTPIVGLKLAPHPGLTTIPYGMQFLAILLSTLPFAKLMDKHGRYKVFLGGAVCLLLAGICGYLAVTQSSFLLLCVTQLLAGLYISTANCYRFAATDGLHARLIARAGTFVIAGGVVAAVIAPYVALRLRDIQGFVSNSAIYLFLSLLALILFVILNIWHRQVKEHHVLQSQTVTPTISTGNITSELKMLVVFGITAGATSYFMKTLMLISATLHLKLQYNYQFVPNSVQLHVLAMFLPFFIVPYLMSKTSKTAVNTYGFLMIALACLLPIFFSGTILINFVLILLGAGWNFAYTSATSIIGSIQGPARLKIQGLNETVIASMATVAAFLLGPAISTLGWENLNIVALVVTVVLIGVLAVLTRKLKAQPVEKYF